MGKPKPPPPPDYTPIANASREAAQLSAQVSREQLQWAREQYWADRDVSDMVIESALERQDTQDADAAEDRERYEQIYQPLEDSLAKDAAEYANPEKLEAEAGKAQADVSQQFAGARASAMDRLESFGVDPTQTRAQALDVSTRMQEAAARAGAGNMARERTEAMGKALRSEAINVGKGYPGQIAQTYNTALQSGNQAVNSGIATTATGSNAMGTPVQWQNQSNQSLNTWSNALTAGYDAQMKYFNAKQQGSSGMGSMLGLIGGIGGKLLTGGMMEEGGAVSDIADAQAIPMGGQSHDGVPVPEELSPSQGAIPDDIPARLNAGEFVVPRDAVSWFGEKHFQGLIQKARKEKEGAQAKPEIKAIPAEEPVLRTALPVG